MAVKFLERAGHNRLAYCHTPGRGAGGSLPTIMFLTGFRSDMEGTKAVYLENACAARGQAYIRFDYSGHGRSAGRFEDGTISQWRDDALAVLDHLTAGPVILVGSSMGGWISLLLARLRPDRVAGLIGLAAAPDFTVGLYEHELTAAQKDTLIRQGYVDLPNDYSEAPYRFTRALIEDGAACTVLDKTWGYTHPVRLIQGMKDTDVPWQTAQRIADAAMDSDVSVILREDGDHRLSQPADLALIDAQVRALSGVSD